LGKQRLWRVVVAAAAQLKARLHKGSSPRPTDQRKRVDHFKAPLPATRLASVLVATTTSDPRFNFLTFTPMLHKATKHFDVNLARAPHVAVAEEVVKALGREVDEGAHRLREGLEANRAHTLQIVAPHQLVQAPDLLAQKQRTQTTMRVLVL
jgi:hypothetical protein